ncbi:MAG: branched-chain amino acid transaminase [Deltaproteobacteria bacterium]|nr:branched-chain amino acid transaminase [Deltaproteobacteria bacterium]MBW2414789.1 branched-chain amino acid transaminase [Deltaproteobacteria bacterium]
MGVEKTEQVWLDGEFVPWDDAQVHILTHTLHYGLGVFEGIRAYRCDDGRSTVFRLSDHVQRLYRSARIVELEIPHAPEQIEAAILETLRVNHLPEGYIRPLVFLGEGAMGLLPADNPVRVAVIVWPWGAYLGDEGLERGIRTKVSSYTRHHPNVTMTQSKTCGNYVNSILAKREVTRLGYDEAIMLDTNGFVSEGSGENLFIVRRGALKTPPLGSVLDGITRDSIIQIARDKGIEVSEQPFARDELYTADEAFMTGTAAEVTPIREVDDRVIGDGARGAITRTLQSTFFDAVRGREGKYDAWLRAV